MSPDSVTATRTTDPRYAALEERVMARDQKGASEVYYDLVREGRPITEMLREAVRIHAPYTHVPYHERMDDGYVNFVNNDHCLLSARAALNLFTSRRVRPVMLKANAADLKILDDLFEKNALRVFIDSRYGLSKLEDAWTRSKSGRAAGKIVITIDE